MIKKTATVVTGIIERDIKLDSWDIVARGTYIKRANVETLFDNYIGKNVKITITEIP